MGMKNTSDKALRDGVESYFVLTFGAECRSNKNELQHSTPRRDRQALCSICVSPVRLADSQTGRPSYDIDRQGKLLNV